MAYFRGGIGATKKIIVLLGVQLRQGARVSVSGRAILSGLIPDEHGSPLDPLGRSKRSVRRANIPARHSGCKKRTHFHISRPFPERMDANRCTAADCADRLTVFKIPYRGHAVKVDPASGSRRLQIVKMPSAGLFCRFFLKRAATTRGLPYRSPPSFKYNIVLNKTTFLFSLPTEHRCNRNRILTFGQTYSPSLPTNRYARCYP